MAMPVALMGVAVITARVAATRVIRQDA
jgi:hypothetical protein